MTLDKEDSNESKFAQTQNDEDFIFPDDLDNIKSEEE